MPGLSVFDKENSTRASEDCAVDEVERLPGSRPIELHQPAAGGERDGHGLHGGPAEAEIGGMAVGEGDVLEEPVGGRHRGDAAVLQGRYADPAVCLAFE